MIEYVIVAYIFCGQLECSNIRKSEFTWLLEWINIFYNILFYRIWLFIPRIKSRNFLNTLLLFLLNRATLINIQITIINRSIESINNGLQISHSSIQISRWKTIDCITNRAAIMNFFWLFIKYVFFSQNFKPFKKSN